MRRKFLLSWFLMLLLITGNFSILNAQVAKVGNTEYATIDEAIANWTNGTTLTLLADVTLSDVIKLSSTEYHILDLSTFTMTAASGKDAIQYVVNGRSSASYALDIKADANNPGGITATGKTIVSHIKPSSNAPSKDRPITRFYGGVFNASYVVKQGGNGVFLPGAGYTGASAPYFQFYGGVFNGTIYLNRSQTQFHGGVFNGSIQMSVDTSAYGLVAGGTFKNLSNSMGSALNSDKFTIGSAKGVYDRDVYIDDNGNYVIVANKPDPGEDGIQADVPKTPGTNDYLAYSRVASEEKLGYTKVEKALNDNKSASVTVYADEIDMSEVTNFSGTIVVPADHAITITNAPANLNVVDEDGNAITPNENGTYTTVEPAGNNFTGYTGEDGIWGEVWGNAFESFVIKVLDANGNVMGTTSLNNVDGIIDGDVNVTWNIKLDAASNTDEYWTMAWTTAPTIDNMPAKVELWVDGVKVSGGNVVLNGPDEINKIYAAVTDANGKILSYHTSIANAVAAAQDKDVIEIIKEGNYTLPEFAGKELTFKGSSRTGTSITDWVNKGSQGMMGSTVHFENLTISGQTENYYGLFHTNAVTYKDCNINGLRFLYSPTTFEDCAFNANGVEHSFWTYGASNVTVTGCTFTYTDRAVNCYSENDPEHELVITFEGCSFTYAGTNDAPEGAVEINSSSVKSIKLVMNGCTAPAKGAMWFNSQWDSTGGLKTEVVVDGDVVWTAPAKIGETKYATLAAAYEAAVNGDVIVLNESVTTFPVIEKAVTFKGGKENAAVEINYALSQNFTAIDGIVRFENLTFNKPLFTEHGGNKPGLSIEFEGCNFNVNSEAGYGILIGTSWSNSVVKGLKVNNCNFKYVGTEFKGGYMLYVQCVNEVTITNNTIDGNNLYRGAIHLGDATEHATVATVSNNTIKNFCRGVMMGNRVVGSSATISGNTFDNINYSDKDSKPAQECAPIFIHSIATAEALQIALTNNEVENCANPMIYSEDTDLIKDYVTEFTGNTVDGAAVELANSYNAPNQIFPVATINDAEYFTLQAALSAASAMTGDVTVEIYEKVTLNLSLSGSYSSIKFVGKDTDAEIYLDVQGYITATGKKVAFEDLKLSKSEGAFIGNAGFMNVAFGVYDVTEVTYTNCVFANGACASSGKVTYTDCTFKKSWDKYGLWAYGNVEITVDDCIFADYRGIKMYAEGAAKTVDLTVKNTNFSVVNDKPAIVLTYGESVTLENNTYSSTGVFELDLDGAPNGTPINYTDDNDEKLTCKNDNGACGVLCDGKIYTTVAQAAEVVTSGSTVTLLHNSTETVELPMGVILDKNGYVAAGVTVAEPIAKIGENVYTSLEAAFEAATEGQTITLLADATPVLTSQRAITKAAVIDLGGKTLTLTEDDLYFGTTEFKNGSIIVDPSVKPSTAVFWMFANQTLTFDNVKLTATDVTGTYLIGLDGNNSDLNILNGSEIIVNNATALDLDIICVNASTGNDIVVDDSKVNVTNLDGRVFFRGNYTIKGESDINLAGITKAGFRIEAGQTLSVEDTSTIDIEGELRDGGIHLTDLTATYTVAETATVNATVNQPVAVAQIGTTKYGTLQAAIDAVQNGETIELLSDVTENVTLEEATDLYYTINGSDKTMNGTITVNSLSDTNDNRRITIKNIKFVDNTDADVDFISSVETNHYPRLTVEGCTFTGSGNNDDVAVRLKSSHSVVIKDCTGTGLHSFLQNTAGWSLTIENVAVTNSKSGLALGTVQGVTVKGSNIDVNGYGIRLDAEYNNNAVIESNAVKAFIPVVVRKAKEVSSITFSGTNTMTASNTDGLWCAIGTSEYETNGTMPTAPTGQVTVTLNDTGLSMDGVYGAFFPVKIGETGYATLAAAAAAAQAGDEIILLADVTEDVSLPAGISITLNGNGKQINGSIVAGGDLTIKGHTKATSFNAGYNQPIITIGAGACLEMNGTGRMVIGHGATFSITGTITDAKNANVADLTPSLIMPGASFTGAGVTFNVTNAYISAPYSYCSSSSSASGTFDFNITNSIWESAGKLAFESQSTAATVNFDLVESVLNTGSHLVFGVSRGEVVIDNSNVNVGTSRQIENRSTMTIKNGAVVNGAVATSSNAINPGTIIVENATYAVTGEFSGAAEGTGTLIINKGANVSVGSIKAGANVVVDAEGMAAGDEINFTANLSQFTGTLSVINNDNLDAKIIDGKIVLVEKPVAKIGETEYATLQAALNAAAQTEELTTIQLLAGTHTFGNVKFPATLKNVTIVGADNKETIIKDSKLYSADGNAVTYKGITFDGIVFDNSSILFTGARSGEVVYEDWTIKNCDFRDLQSIDGIAAIHFNLLADETIKNFTFEKNTITNVTSPNNTASGLRLNYVTGNVVIKDNETNNVAFNAVQIINSVVDNFTFEGNILRSNGSSLANLYNVTGENIVITKNQFLVANEDQIGVSNIAYTDVSGNYWGGGAPTNLPEGVVYSSYYTTVESDGTLGGLVELPQGNNFTGYTGVDGIWGEVWGNAKESFVIKVLDANDNVMGTTSLNNVGGIIDGDVTVTWSLKLDAASNTDEYWTMSWTTAPYINTTAPYINNMPAKVELWVDGVKVSGGNVVLNGPDNLNVIYAAVTDAEGKILSYHTSIAAAVAAAQQGNTIALLRDTDEEIKLPFGVTLNLNGFDAPNVTFTLPTAMIGETEYASVADALAAAQAANLADVVITIIGENTAATADNFNLVYKNKFDKVTFKQNNGGKVYYFNELYTGSRTNNGEFVFDGVNLVVTGQYMFEGNVKLSNNSFVKSTAEANCFVYYAEVTVEAGSKIDGVIEDIRGGSLIIDGGKTDGTYCSEPGLRDAILTVNWTSSNLVLKNGAYVKVNSANEVGCLTVNGEMRVTDSKLESYQWIQVNENATLTLNAGSDITTQEVRGAGNIIVDVTGLEGQATVIKGDMTGFTGTITVNRGFYTVTADGLVVERGLSGKGTEAEPYLITDADELHLFRQSVNAGETRYNNSDVWVVLNADIDLDVTRSASNWEPIGTFDYSFDGNFDGKGHIIKNLKIYDNTTAANGEAYLGFFGVTANNTIKNFVIENVTIESEGQIVAAAIAYPYYTEVSDITVKGDIKIKGGNYTAGVLAYTRLCQKASNLTVSGNEGSYIEGAQTVGGVIADIQMNHGLVANYSNFTAEGLTIKGTKSVGGISGIIAAQTLNVATVNNVTLNCEDDRVGIVSGALGGASTITNVTVDNVTGATNIIGATYDGAKPIAAKIGDTYYGTLANALAADGEESVELLAPITIAVGETVVYNLNGKTVVATDNATGNYAMITNKGNLTIEGEGKLQLTATNNRGWSAYSSVISNTVGGKLTVNGGTIEHLGGTDMAYAIDNLTNGQGTYAETVINGGTMKSTYRAIRQFLNGVEAQNILTVTGGTIEGANKSIWMQDPSANANTGTLTVGVDAKLVGDAYLTVTAGSTEWPVEVAIAAAALQGESTVLTSNVPENYIVKNNNGVWGVFSAVASVNGVNYATLIEAVDAVEDGGTITLIANETFTENNRYYNGGWWDGLGYSGDKSFTIDLGGFTIGQDGALNDYLMWFKNDGAKDNTITLKNGILDAGTTAFCALATASSNAKKITVNLENIHLINNNSNAATLKIRGGAELNVNADTKITGKNSYVGIECYGATVNIYDGAEIYQNGTTSNWGCLVGVSGNGTVNVYGGEGTSAKGGFIAMTSGGTINIFGGEWTANTDGTIANDNNGVLIAQSDKQYNAGAGNSIVNVTGGTFKGGYNCYGNAVGDAQINISGGNFNADPSAYVDDDDYRVVPKNDGTFDVIQIAGTQTRDLQAGWNWFSSYVDLSQEGGLLKLQTALGESGLAIKGQTENQSVQYVKIGVVEGEEIYAWTGNQNWNPYSNKMYMIKTSKAMSAEEFGINGNFIDYKTTTIALFQGWNWISYPLNEPALINEALVALNPTEGDQIKFRGNTFAEYYNGKWYPEDFVFMPGEGYMYKAESPKSFVYTKGTTNVSTNKTDENNNWMAQTSEYANNMTITAMLSIDGEIVKGNYEVAAFANGECRGSARPIYIEAIDAYVLYMTIYGDEVEELTFMYYDIDKDTEYELSNVMNYSNDAIVGTLSDPYIFSMNILGIGENSIDNINIYPNPTTTDREINLQATCDKVEVFNALGVKVAEYHNVDTLDALETAGIYVIRVTDNNEVKHCRLVVK